MKKLMPSLLGLLLLASTAEATTAYYQPSPFPLYKSDGSAMPQNLDIVHLWDGWLNNSYNQTLVRDDKLQDGGWGDQYRTYVNLDLKGLPYNPDSAILWFKTYDKGDGSTTTPFAFCKVGSSWDTNLSWNTQPSTLTCAGWFTPPTPGNWWGINYTSWYNEWKAGTVTNNGIMMFPQNTNNNFNMFRSSRYATSLYRPILQFDFTPTLELKMPLPGGHKWLLTTETGGWDCMGSYDQYHDGTNYFAVDFSWRNHADTGMTEYGQYDNIPILASASGKVVFAGKFNPPDPRSDNGYYVVIDHDGDGNLNTGVSTRYLHLKTSPVVSTNDTVQQGDLLGYMGDTGLSEGVHLHFGVRYQDNGSSNVSQLTKVVMDGSILRSYQTECIDEDSDGKPDDWNHYYESLNTTY